MAREGGAKNSGPGWMWMGRGADTRCRGDDNRVFGRGARAVGRGPTIGEVSLGCIVGTVLPWLSTGACIDHNIVGGRRDMRGSTGSPRGG